MVVEKLEEEKLSTKMNTMNKVGDAASADVDNGREEKLTVVVIGAAAGDHPTPIVVDGKKLKAWLTQSIMWSIVYYLMYWIWMMVMIKMDYYGVATFLHGIIPFSLLFFAALVGVGIQTVNQINSLVLFVNNNIIPSPGTFRTTSIDEMKEEIIYSSVGLLLCSLGYNFIHMISIEISKIIMEFIGTKNKVDGSADDWNSQMLFAGGIFLVTFLHALWYDLAIHEELGLNSEACSNKHQHRSTKPHTDNTH